MVDNLHKQECKYIYKKGKNKGCKCNHSIHFKNRDLCNIHQNKKLSIYKSNFKTNTPIDCIICTESIEINNKNDIQVLQCGHIVHYFCICKNAAMNAKFHTCDLNVLVNWNLTKLIIPFLKCPLCQTKLTNKRLLKYWDKEYIYYLYECAHKNKFNNVLYYITLIERENYVKWLSKTINNIINIYNYCHKIKTQNINYLITFKLCLYILYSELANKSNNNIINYNNITSASTSADNIYTYNNKLNNLIICLDIIKLFKNLELNGAPYLKYILKGCMIK